MSFDNGDGYWHCPHCGNNGDQGDVTAEGRQWVSGWQDFEAEILDVCDEDRPDDWSVTEEGEIDTDDTCDHEWHRFYCCVCGVAFCEFEYSEYDEWEENWGGEDGVLSRADHRAVEETATRTAATIQIHLKAGDGQKARAISAIVETTQDLDALLKTHEEMNYSDFGVYPKGHKHATFETRRLFEVGRELGAFGYRGTRTPREMTSGCYMLSVHRGYMQLDDELLLDMGTDSQKPSSWPIRMMLRIGVIAETPMGPMEVKVFYIGVPSVEERQEGKDDPEQQCVIFEMPINLIEQTSSLTGVKCDGHIWPGELIEKLTFYRCERASLAHTLEIVFDMTPQGYLPLLKKAGIEVEAA